MNLFKLLNGNNYIVINRPLAHKIGINPSIFLSELLDKYEYFKKNGELSQFDGIEGEWFYLTIDDVTERTTLTEKEQRTAYEKLEELEFVKKIIKGVPGKRYFQIQERRIEEFFNLSKKDSRTDQKAKLEPPLEQKQNLPKGERIYKEPKEEPKEETQSISQSPPVAALSWIDRLKEEISATDEEIKMAAERMKQTERNHGKPIMNPKNWMKATILDERARRKEIAAIDGIEAEVDYEATPEEMEEKIKRILEYADGK